ncbi:MAG: hypothetical protein WA996_04935 [Candidatus Promineifilaceae bacterium]
MRKIIVSLSIVMVMLILLLAACADDEPTPTTVPATQPASEIDTASELPDTPEPSATAVGTTIEIQGWWDDD